MILLVFSIAFFFICFHLLSSTAETYLSPAVTSISNFFGMSETMAGVTLVALGNGAPDVLVAIAGGSDGDFSLSIGSIFGAGLFVTTITLAKVIDNAGGELNPDKRFFQRDAIFYFISSSVIILFGIIGFITWYMSLIFLSLYLIYFGVVLYLERLQKMEKLSQLPRKLDYSLQPLDANQVLDNSNQEEDELVQVERFNERIVAQQKKEDQIIQKRLQEENQIKSRLLDTKEVLSLNEFLIKDFFIITHDTRKSKNKPISFYTESSKKKKQSQHSAGVFYKFNLVRHEISSQMLNVTKNWDNMEFGDKLTLVWEIPVDFFRNLIIPPVEENWNRRRAIVSCLLGPFFFVSLGGIIPGIDGFGDDWIVSVVFAAIGVLCSIFVWKTAHHRKPPSYIWVLAILAVMNSIAVIGIVADYLIAFLNFIQIQTQISKAYLGMTFLAFGNSASDYFTNGQLAKMGFGMMAFTACYAGQLFNLLIGFGISLVISSFKGENKQVAFQLFKPEVSDTYNWLQTIISFGILIFQWLNIGIMIAIGMSSRYKFGPNTSYFLRAYYILVFVTMTGLGIASDLTRDNSYH